MGFVSLMNAPLEKISLAELGERLRIAREGAGVTQSDAAGVISAARTTVVAIEQGQRRVRIDELQKLTKLYKTNVNALLRNEAVHVDLTPKFRRLIPNENDATIAATKLLASLAKAEVELENLLGVRRGSNLPSERPILPGDVRAQADQDALELRQQLGLGLAPVSDIVTLLELELGVRVYVRRFDGGISGLFAYDEALGACILLNAHHPRERRTLTAAHELAHLVCNRREPDIVDDNIERSIEERYCNAFARSFLMPARAVKVKFKELTLGSARLTRRHVIILAHAFGVSREAMVRRFEELGLTKGGTWDWFQDNGGISDDQARQVLGDLIPEDKHKVEASRPTTIRINMLAAEAARQGLMSEGQLARLLNLNRVELRDLLDSSTMEGSAADEAPILPD
jgi:Zn-dependent peptidase ImmA (M78 family)/transcriptional regulator with XRE-family HTH domain